MSLRAVVAAPFQSRGRSALEESAFIVSLSLDRDWFSPDQASQVVDKALGDGLLERTDGALRTTFDPDGVAVPSDFTPDEDLLRETTPFEAVLDALVSAGMDKQDAVAGINQLQADLGITVAAAAIVYARSRGVDVDDAAERARAALIAGEDQ